ncbi:hypothetical protein CC78DRAFT_285561 [Lojkania enalia]|uniref:DUF7820 domain-containing protein n=1 Tax=Lojkania enalia TaxID=147567 RepID=A0A9P4N2B3_9PLEO|nr:hypothetical protein CC78DRAFT_285561 [Didymosphaeria enalia]
MVSLDEPQQKSSACLARNSENAAWSCFPRRKLRWTFTQNMRPNGTDVSIEPKGNSAKLMYGAQSPSIGPLTLIPGSDPELPEHGPAYYFSALYNRTVILTEKQIGSPAIDQESISPDNTTINIGDSVYECFFNHSRLEGYIFINKQSQVHNESMPDRQAMLPFLPFALKLVERRSPNTPQPYCLRMQMRGNGDLKYIGADGDHEGVMRLTETHAELKPARREEDRYVQRKKQASTQACCRCQYMLN